MEIVLTKFTKEQVLKIEQHFSNLNFLRDFVDDPQKDLKVSESGKKANMRLPKLGNIIGVSLEKNRVETNEDKDSHECMQIVVEAQAINSKINFILDYFSDKSTIPAVVSVRGEFNPVLGPINSFIFRNFVEGKLEDTIREKIEKVAKQ